MKLAERQSGGVPPHSKNCKGALATWYAPPSILRASRHGAATWKYFGANLDHIPLIFLFAIFFATRAGEKWGIDGLRRKREFQTRD